MSTYYFMSCEEHKKRTEKVIAVTRAAGSHIDHADQLLDFLLKHQSCPLKFFSEYDDERYEYEKASKP